MRHLLEVYDIVTELCILSQLIKKLRLDLRIGLDRYRAGARYSIPDTIGCSCTDTDINAGNDVTYSLGHAYVTHVVHSVHTFQNITSLMLCFQTYVRYAYNWLTY